MDGGSVVSFLYKYNFDYYINLCSACFLSNTVLSTFHALNHNFCSQQLCVHYYYSHFIGEEIGVQKVK